MFTLDELVKRARPGDIGLTRNPAGLGKLINFGQGIEDGNGGSRFGHVVIFAEFPDGVADSTAGRIYESVKTISMNHVVKYSDVEMLIMRHRKMTRTLFYEGRKEIVDNLGMIYPYHRIVFHGFDMINAWVKRSIFRRKAPLKFRYMKFMPLDWPVCSELGAQFIHKAGLKGGWESKKKGWRGVNPDDFHDAATSRKDLWEVVVEGTLGC